MKKLTCLVLSIIMTLSLSITALAATVPHDSELDLYSDGTATAFFETLDGQNHDIRARLTVKDSNFDIIFERYYYEFDTDYIYLEYGPDQDMYSVQVNYWVDDTWTGSDYKTINSVTW